MSSIQKDTANKSESQHTPMPWTFRKKKFHFVIEAANGVAIADVRFHGRPDGSTTETDTAFIVHACNNFYGLVEALERIVNLESNTHYALRYYVAKELANHYLAKARRES